MLNSFPQVVSLSFYCHRSVVYIYRTDFLNFFFVEEGFSLGCCTWLLECGVESHDVFTKVYVKLIIISAFAGPTATEKAVIEDDDDEDFDDEEESSEADDDGRIYKNPRNSPSVDCPRDEEQATLLGQKCLRKCSSDEDCKSKKKKCLCDGACGMSCIKPGKIPIQNSSVK